MGYSTSAANGDQSFLHLDNIISLLMVLVSLCGAAGNGAVVWLLKLPQKKKRFSVYIRTLACADGLFLLVNGILYTVLLVHPEFQEWGNLWAMFQLIRLGLLVAVTTERCVSGPGPLRHPWLCLDRFSSVVGLFICVLSVCMAVSESVCDRVGAPCHDLGWAYVVTVIITLLVLCVSSLTLLVRIQCGSQGTRPSRLDVSILLTVLAFLLLGLPYTVHVLVLTIAPDTVYVPGLWETLGLLSTLSITVNPVIYFFVGRHRQQPGRTPLREVLQRVLSDDEERLSGQAPSSSQTPLRLLRSVERAVQLHLDRPPSRAATQEAGSPAVSLEEEAAPILTH